MSEHFKEWIEATTIVSITIIIIFIIIYTILQLKAFPKCTAYQAIDGKPVCVEYQLKTN
jgi:hypothetical protein